MKKLLLLMLPLTLLLAGCSITPGNEIGPDATGIWNTIIMWFSYGMIWIGSVMNDNIINGLIVMTILFRLAMVPLFKAQIKTSSQMGAMKPEMDKIKKKYEGKNDVDSKRKMQEDTAALYKRHNINPLAGCLPMIVQMPLLFAFYAAISNLLVYEGLQKYGAETMSQSFLIWSDLGQPVIIFAFLAAITTYLTTVVSTYGTDQGDNQMMKSMKIVMPVMIFFMGLNFPGALSLYWLIGNIFTIIQNLIMKRDVIKAHRDKKKMNK
ncbi:MAG: YidC/Oxa1 family membrane protein insertase [Mycoplasmatales bacterium]